MADILMYWSPWCGDCRQAQKFLKEHGIAVREINVDEDPDAEDLVLKVNKGRRKVPTFAVDGRYFASSPFDPAQVSRELNIPSKA
jgi:mycoredoxin